MKLRGNYLSDVENFFIFRDRTPVKHHHVWKILKTAIKHLNLNPDCYNFQLTHIGRASGLLKFGFSIEKIKRTGRWKSNTVYKYIRPV